MNSLEASSTPNNPWEWQLTNENQLEDEDSYYNALTFLITDDEWMKSPEVVRRVVNLMIKTNLASQKAELVYQKLFQNHLMVKFELPDKSVRKLLKETVITQSNVFENQLSERWKENDVINLCHENKEIAVSDLNCFLDYFSSGNINLSGENVLFMLILSKKYDVPKLEEQCLQFLNENLNLDNSINIFSYAIKYHAELEQQCLQFLNKNLNLDNFLNIFSLAIKLQHADLGWRCLSFAIENQAKIDSLLEKQISENKPILPAIKQLIVKARHFKENSIEIIVFKSGIPVIKILDGKNLAPWQFLDEMSKLLPIKRLELTENRNFDLFLEFVKGHPNLYSLDLSISKDIDDNKLEKLAKNLPNIYAFFIYKATITTLPFSIANQVKVLYCMACRDLVELHLPQVKYLNCNGCWRLRKLGVPEAEKIICSSTLISELIALRAKEIDCQECNALKKIYATQAEWLNCFYCPGLIEFSADQVKTLYCSSCWNLPELNVPQAKKIDCNDCWGLKKLTAIQATEINCTNCKELSALIAPQVEKLDCKFCGMLPKIDAPRAKEIDCYGCTSLPRVGARPTEGIPANCEIVPLGNDTEQDNS